MKILTCELTGMALDYSVAIIEGYGWAKNASSRSGDSFGRYQNSNHKDGWPIGSRCFVRPSSLKDLDKSKKNRDGWLECDMTESLAPEAFYGMPSYSKSWSSVGDIYEKLVDRGMLVQKSKFDNGYIVTLNNWENCTFGKTLPEAILRCYVMVELGFEIDIPKELL